MSSCTTARHQNSNKNKSTERDEWKAQAWENVGNYVEKQSAGHEVIIRLLQNFPTLYFHNWSEQCWTMPAALNKKMGEDDVNLNLIDEL